ncbi:MAG TPA: vitamin K epoxide reductase family protein [Symbiobacteriaceae bacterium]|jgi:uncharacterized membrane protein
MTLRRTLQGLLALSFAGLGISVYLAFEYLTGGTPICSGSSGCSQVQLSPYAWIGPIPIPVLGAVVYVALIVLAALALTRPEQQPLVVLALFGISLAGVLFSAYLTYLELFVIIAICKWCVGSAVVMTLIFVLAILAYRQSAAESA